MSVIGVIPWFFTVANIAILITNGKKMRITWILVCICQAGGTIYYALTHQYGFLPSNVIIITLAIRNYFLWRADDLQRVSAE